LVGQGGDEVVVAHQYLQRGSGGRYRPGVGSRDEGASATVTDDPLIVQSDKTLLLEVDQIGRAHV
jgi:hypothetical protein